MNKRMWTLPTLMGTLFLVIFNSYYHLSQLSLYRELKSENPDINLPTNPLQVLGWQDIGLVVFLGGFLFGIRYLKQSGGLIIVISGLLSILPSLQNTSLMVPQMLERGDWLSLIGAANSELHRIGLIIFFLFIVIWPLSRIPQWAVGLVSATSAITLLFLLGNFFSVPARELLGILFFMSYLLIHAWFIVFFFKLRIKDV